MEIISQNENKLLGRKDVMASITSDGATVSRTSVRKELSKKFKVDEAQVIINSINSIYGSLNVQVDAVVYDKKDAIDKITTEHILKRNKIEEPVVEETSNDVPVEEVKEEVKEEEKKEEA